MVRRSEPFTLEEMDATIAGANLDLELRRFRMFVRGGLLVPNNPLYMYYNCVGLREWAGCGPIADYMLRCMYSEGSPFFPLLK